MGGGASSSKALGLDGSNRAEKDYVQKLESEIADLRRTQSQQQDQQSARPSQAVLAAKDIEEGVIVKRDYMENLENELDLLRSQKAEAAPLLDVNDAELIRTALHEAAGCPAPTEDDFSPLDHTTWSLRALEDLSDEELLKVADAAEENEQLPHKFVKPEEQNKELISLVSVSLDCPFSDVVWPNDKNDLTTSTEQLVLFDVDVALFKQAPSNFLPLLVGEDSIPQHLSLFSSPISTVTLPAHARSRARIPLQASFYNFCYPYLKNGSAQELLKGTGVDSRNPIVSWMLLGAFVYFNHSYDIVAINAIRFVDRTTTLALTRLLLGASSPLPPLSRGKLEAVGRFAPVTQASLVHVRRFAWIRPSELLGDHIFTKSGGFAYEYEDGSSLFFPVVAPNLRYKKLEPLVYSAPVHIPEFIALKEGGALSSKYAGDISKMVFADSSLSALGIQRLLGYEDSVWADYMYALRSEEDSVKCLRAEFEKSGTEEDKEMLAYILDQPAVELSVTGNDGRVTIQDSGHNGWTLARFRELEPSQLAQLTLVEVCALRLYTSKFFRQINGPLRQRASEPDYQKWKDHPHPFPFTTYLISSSLKKLRVVNLRKKNFKTEFLYRGMKNLDLPADFMKSGGAEFACMSTSSDLSVIAGYALSANPLLFKIKVDTPMDMGCDISWLSLFPGEAELLYPPLTFLLPVHQQPIKGVEGGTVVTLKPSFPS